MVLKSRRILRRNRLGALLNYNIFDRVINSDIPLTELQHSCGSVEAELHFHCSELPLVTQPISWIHEWENLAEQTVIAIAKEGNKYLVRFPGIADFKICPTSFDIVCFRQIGIPDETIRHLLLDQIIPRLLCHVGEQILHASCVKLGNGVVAFCGGSGIGKSTLAAYFSTRGHSILSDDCILIKNHQNKNICIPNYLGIRLREDILSLFMSGKKTVPVAHYGMKRRVLLQEEKEETVNNLRNVFVLTDPRLEQTKPCISLDKISSLRATIELIKNSFPLDITDKNMMGDQLKKLVSIVRSPELDIYQLRYKREVDLLPKLYDIICSCNISGEQ